MAFFCGQHEVAQGPGVVFSIWSRHEHWDGCNDGGIDCIESHVNESRQSHGYSGKRLIAIESLQLSVLSS